MFFFIRASVTTDVLDLAFSVGDPLPVLLRYTRSRDHFPIFGISRTLVWLVGFIRFFRVDARSGFFFLLGG